MKPVPPPEGGTRLDAQVRPFRNGYGHMVHDYFRRRLEETRREREKKLRSIRSRRQAEAYRDSIAETVHKLFRPLPRKTSLRAQVTGSLERDGYRVEKVLFQSRPGFLVSGNLYLPTDRDGPFPAVLGSCGHSAEGKAAPRYQAFCQRLVRAGFVVLIYDPLSQGERDQYEALPRDHPLRTRCTHAHNMAGKQLELLGDFFGNWRVWDGIRALDYLLSRPEVDGRRVGMTGNSGGGTLTTWIWSIERRLRMAAPACFVTTFRHNFENELPSDAEQYPPGALAAGIEMADFLIARAPDPLILLGQKYCFFDRRGLDEAHREISRVYRLLGAAENLRYCLGNHTHGYHRDIQTEMVHFFCHQSGIPLPARDLDENAVGVELPAALASAPGGQVARAGNRPVHEFIAAEATRLAVRRSALPRNALLARLRRILKLPRRRGIPRFRVLRPEWDDTETHARYAVETEPGIEAIMRKYLHGDCTLAHTLDTERKVALLLPHLSAEVDLRENCEARKLKTEGPLYAIDVRGMGESAPDERCDFFHPYGTDYLLHGFSLLFGECYLGRRVFDTLRIIDLLIAEGTETIRLYGRGQGAVIAAFTALFEPRVEQLTLIDGPFSFSDWTNTPELRWPAANVPRGILKWCDFRDCLRAVPGTVRVTSSWGPHMEG